MKNNQFNNQENDTNKRKKMKKRILIILAGLVAFIILYFLVLQNIDVDSFFKKKDRNQYDPTKQTIIFSPIDYNEDVFKDLAYMDKDRNIYYYNGVEKISINENGNFDYSEYEEPVEFLGDMIDLIITGNHERYNECFSQVYYSHEGNKAKEDFTMQKLYNITLSKQSEDTKSDNGNYYKEYVFIVEYMIYKNNGTFRTDVGSDAIRKQIVKLSDRTGSILIDSISYEIYTN